MHLRTDPDPEGGSLRLCDHLRLCVKLRHRRHTERPSQEREIMT